MARFEVVEQQGLAGPRRYAVVDHEDKHRPVAHFAERDAAQAHADKLEAGPLDWEEQEAWQDEWDDDQQR